MTVYIEEQMAKEATNDSEESETDQDQSASTEDIDLGSLDALESFNKTAGEPLLEEQESLIIPLTEDDLPSPEELDSDVDFTENN